MSIASIVYFRGSGSSHKWPGITTNLDIISFSLDDGIDLLHVRYPVDVGDCGRDVNLRM
jgi:hypothetical protein